MAMGSEIKRKAVPVRAARSIVNFGIGFMAASEAESKWRCDNQQAGNTLRIGSVDEDVVRRFMIEVGVSSRHGYGVDFSKFHCEGFWPCAQKRVIQEQRGRFAPEKPTRRSEILPPLHQRMTKARSSRLPGDQDDGSNKMRQYSAATSG